MTTRIRHKSKAAIHVGPAPTPPERQEPGKPWSGSRWWAETLQPQARAALERRPALRMEGR